MLSRFYKLCAVALLHFFYVFQLVAHELPMVFIVPSYNNARYFRANLDSICSQNYANWRMIYIDDCSSDKTYELVKAYIDEHRLWDRVTLIRNTQRVGALENIYNAIHSCNNWEIMVNVDGDDFLAHNNVLQVLNNVYSHENVWLTYGQFVEYPAGVKGFCEAFPESVIRSNSFRKYGCPVSHLRTFYAWLFNKIDREDLLHEGKFYPMTWDKAMMLPMLEMCGGRFKFISDVLYVYNFVNPINDCRVNGPLQAGLARVILNKKPYSPLQAHEIPAK